MLSGGEAMERTRKIRFVEPASRAGRPFNMYTRRWPLMGPIILATMLHQRGYDVRIHNENISGHVEDDPETYQDICSADVVGFSIMTPTAMRAYELANRIREDTGRPTLVFGGSHATFKPQEALAYGDLVVRGEAENIIEDIASGEVDEGIVQAEPPRDLDQLPTPNHHLVRDFNHLVESTGRQSRYPLPAMTSRGCPHACKYCSVTRMFGRRVRRQSVDKVTEDLQNFADQGFRRVFFYDDNFTQNRRWTRELLERVGPLNMHFSAQTRVDFHWENRRKRKKDEELVQAMKRSGGDVLYVGYETIDDSTAEEWHKGYGKNGGLEARLAEDTHILHDMGFWVHGMFILGPQHTESNASRIVDFARRAALESMQISVLTPFPGTPLMDEMRPYLVFRDFPQDWDYFDGAHCTYNHGRLGLTKLQNVVLRAHEKFYTAGRSTLRRVRKILNAGSSLTQELGELWRHIDIAKETFKAWKKETAVFLELARSKLEGNTTSEDSSVRNHRFGT